MNTRSNRSPYEVINAKLQEVIQNRTEAPPWYVAWRRLDPTSKNEEWLAVFRAIRDDGCLSKEAGFYLVSYETDAIVSEHAETALLDLEERMFAIEKAHGLADDDKWLPGEAPAEFETARLAYDDAWDQLFLDRLQADGEHEMARLFRSSKDEYDRQVEAGRRFFFGERSEDDEIEAWLEAMMNDVGGCIEAQGIMGPLGGRYRVEGEFIDVVVFPTPVELVGGADDGDVFDVDYMLDLEQLRAAFDRVDALGWSALGQNDPLGPHVSVEGVYQGRETYLQVLAAAPEDAEPGIKFDVNDKKWR
jgi:hypothetical protein